jgi:hypothetical protein
MLPLSPPSPLSPATLSPASPASPLARPHSTPLHVVCDAPLLAPVPLPYHSPTFLQFELPDIDQDLSRPPYVKQSRKRKRGPRDHLDAAPSKRRSAGMPPAPRLQPRHHRPSAWYDNPRLLPHQALSHPPLNLIDVTLESVLLPPLSIPSAHLFPVLDSSLFAVIGPSQSA